MRKQVTVTLVQDDRDGRMTFHISQPGMPGMAGDDYAPIQRGEMLADLGECLMLLVPRKHKGRW